MTISPETLAEQMLGQEVVSKKDKAGLFLEDAVVAIFDGLIIFRGNLNMIEAIPRLQAISMGLGLPIAVIEKQVFKKWSKKKYKVGKHVGPGNWMMCSWNTEEGFDFGLKEKYNNHGIEKDVEENEKKPTTTGKSTQTVDRSHLSGNSTSHHNSSLYPSRHRDISHHQPHLNADDDQYWEDQAWYN